MNIKRIYNLNIALAVFLSALAAHFCFHQLPIASKHLPQQTKLAATSTPAPYAVFEYDKNDVITKATYPNNQVWQFGYEEKHGPFGSIYHELNKINSASGRVYTRNGKKWNDGQRELDGNFYLEQRTHNATFRPGTLYLLRDNDTYAVVAHPLGYTVETNNNGDITKITGTQGQVYELTYGTTGLRKPNKPNKITGPNFSWTKQKDKEWLDKSGAIWKGEIYAVSDIYTWSDIRACLGYGSLVFETENKRIARVIRPSGCEVLVDPESKRPIKTTTADGRTIEFGYSQSVAKSATASTKNLLSQTLTSVRTLNGTKFTLQSDGKTWLSEDGKVKRKGKFADVEMSSDFGFGSLWWEGDDGIILESACGTTIYSRKNYVVEYVFYADGTSRSFKHTSGSWFNAPELVEFTDINSWIWSKKDKEKWEANQNDENGKHIILNGDYYVSSSTSQNSFGYAAVFKTDNQSSTRTISATTLPGHISREHCTNQCDGPRGNCHRNCREDYYLAP
jgi:hypothetical protein